MPTSPGRPRRASQQLLQEAAFELFQLRGYRGTSVEQIARTAGFSRATFFNFFSSKAELFWVETDALIAALSEFLVQRLADPRPPALEDALLDFSESLSSSSIPWALQNYRLLEAADDLVASGASRVLGLNRLLRGYLQRSGRGGEDPGAVAPAASVLASGASTSGASASGVSASGASASGASASGVSAIDPDARAAAVTALLLAALLGWIDAGVHRGGFRAHLERVLAAG